MCLSQNLLMYFCPFPQSKLTKIVIGNWGIFAAASIEVSDAIRFRPIRRKYLIFQSLFNIETFISTRNNNYRIYFSKHKWCGPFSRLLKGTTPFVFGKIFSTKPFNTKTDRVISI